MDQIPEKVNEILHKYFDKVESTLPKVLDSYYLYGSTSLAEFKVGVSDIDFIAVVNRTLNENDIDILKQIHHDMQKRYSKTILDGWYITLDDIKFADKKDHSCLRFNDGKFHGYTTFDTNSIDAFQLKKYGITIKGRGIEDLDYSVNWDSLIENMRVNLNSYWSNWLHDCQKVLSIKSLSLLVSLGMVEWGVLGISRLYYTFREGDMTSKVGAGEYALSVVPERWHVIINESMRLRKGNNKSYYHSIIKRRKDTLEYIEFMIKECNNLFDNKR